MCCVNRKFLQRVACKFGNTKIRFEKGLSEFHKKLLMCRRNLVVRYDTKRKYVRTIRQTRKPITNVSITGNLECIVNIALPCCKIK